ncbi:MAG TPA: sensor histidine kinase, partial [Candidatus Limnocylindria bacterium]
PGDRLAYVVEREGGRATFSVQLGRYPLAAVLAASWSTILWLAAMAAMAVYLFLRRPAEAATRALLIAATAILASTLPWLTGLGPADVVAGVLLPALFLVATFALYQLFWSAVLHFSLVFPQPIAGQPRQRRLVLLAYLLPAAAQLAWMAGTAFGAPNLLAWIGGWTVAQLVIVPAVIIAIGVAQVVQWRRSTPVERAWLRGIALASGIAIVGVLAGWYLPQAVTGSAFLPWSAIGLPGMAFPLALGVAVGRGQLFGIESVVRRSLVYGGLTAAVVLAYATTVVVLGAVLNGEGPYAVTLLATGVAALVALPVRDRLQRGVGRLLYGDRDEPQRAIARLSERLAAAPEPAEVLPMVAETVADALRLPYAAIELRRDDGVSVAAAHGTPRGGLERLALVHRGEEIGWLALAPRTPGEAFSAADRALLAELARQAGAAAYAVRLTSELQRSRQQLVTAREEERRRLRRDLHDGVGPALAGSLMKLEAARAVAQGDAGEADRLLAELAAETRQAIDDIRRMAYELRPPALDQLGLGGALELEARRLAGNGVSVHVQSPPTLPGLPAAVEVAAYRIAMEALTNVIRHAAARNAWMELRLSGRGLEVEVRDDGAGMAVGSGPGIGLTSMRERAEELDGALEIGAASEGGLRVTATLPLPGDGAGG